MSDVLSRILAGVMGGGTQDGSGMGGAGMGGSPLGDPRLRRGESPGHERGGMPGGGGGLGDIFGGGGMGGGMGGGLGGILGGLLGGMGGGAQPGRGAPMGGGLGGLASGLGGMKGMALMALLAYMMRGQGGRQGLSSLTDQLRGAGMGDHVDSWVGPGANRDVRPEEIARAIPPEALDDIERHTGMGRDEVLSELSRGLPQMVDRLTPKGQMPQHDDDLNDIDERDVLGSFGIGGAPGAAYGKQGPGQGGSKF